MINPAAVLVAILTVTGSSMPAEDPEAVVREFLRAAYSHDAARFNALVFPASGAGLLLSTEPVAKDRLIQIEKETKTLQLKQLQPFRQRGVVVTPGPDGVFPDGATTRYLTSYNGNLTVVSLVKREGRWLVDVRWWLKLREMSLRGEKDKLDEKELVIKTFLLDLLRLNRRAVTENLVPGADVDIVFREAPRVPEPSDVLPSLAIEMPLVEAEADEVYPLLSGKLVNKGASVNEAVMVGLYGQFEMVFQLRRINGRWRIVPEPYYRILNR
ncbi:MAG TPA: hypothetical protein VNS63_01725 [Blastocatellia bacterium]|nr:hypothetical protein [Blastocatellia bacterium]